MEINHSSIGKSEQIVLSWEGSSQAKSYTCAFCKRGFSNAQALGGHMNIHRRDRAKLRDASGEKLLSLDIASSTDPADHISPQVLEHRNSQSSEERICADRIPSREDDATPRNDGREEHQQQLPLFVESKDEDHEKEKWDVHGSTDKAAELDLELRLGPEPHETSARSTREFF